MVNDAIGDFITRIRNEHARSHAQCRVPYSKVLENVSEVLFKEGYILKYSVVPSETNNLFSDILVVLRYFNDRPAILDIKRVSKPSRRVYCKSKNIPLYRNGIGNSIISTNRGIMPGWKAKKFGCGGEVMFMIF